MLCYKTRPLPPLPHWPQIGSHQAIHEVHIVEGDQGAPEGFLGTQQVVEVPPREIGARITATRDAGPKLPPGS